MRAKPLVVLAFAALALPAAAPAESWRIVLSQPDLEIPYRVTGADRAKAWAAQHPGVQLLILDGQRNSATQMNGIEDAITRGADAIVMSPNDSRALAPVGGDAKRAGIPLIVFDRKLAAPDDDIAAFIGSDNEAMGRIAADAILKAAGETGTVIEIEGTPGASATVDRKAGFEAEMKRHPGIHVVSYVGNYRTADAVNVMEDAIVAHPDAVAVYAHNDSMALGAVQVLGEHGHKLPVVGMDGGKAGCDAVHDGTMLATVQYPTMMPEAMELALQVLHHAKVPARTMVDTPLVTATNWAQYCR